MARKIKVATKPGARAKPRAQAKAKKNPILTGLKEALAFAQGNPAPGTRVTYVAVPTKIDVRAGEAGGSA